MSGSLALTGDGPPGSGNGVGGGAASFGSTQQSPDAASWKGSPGRKRNRSIAGLDSSPGANDSEDGTIVGNGDDLQSLQSQDYHMRKASVKRACNECRQQKVGSSLIYSTNSSLRVLLHLLVRDLVCELW